MSSCNEPDSHLEHGGAHCSLWWSTVPQLEGQRIGYIGRFHASEDDGSAAVHLLIQASAHLAKQGCQLAVGPMDGSTWQKYRLVTERGSEPMFFLEPDTPLAWVEMWQQAGFRTLAGYSSTLVQDLQSRDARLDGVRRRLEKEGVCLRSMRSSSFLEDLRRIYTVSAVAFTGNFLYAPIDCDSFLNLYRPLEKILIPDLVLLAERGDTPVGFVFAVPDLLEAKRGVPVQTLVVKTLAVLPERSVAGLGKVLVEAIHAAGHERGFTRAIHALMHDQNQSRNLGNGAKTIRRYELFARELP